MVVVASIPSPGSNALEIGPLKLNAYGLMIALGVVAAVWLCQRRWAARGHDPEDIIAIAMVAVPAGVVGARIYHVITDNERYRDNWLEAFELWNGGLGIWGGVAGGVLGAYFVIARRGLPFLELLDVAAPALPLAQAIGRLGNWFNQELFGRPTDLPWGLEIDLEHRPVEYLEYETFHPTFAYEALWNLLLVAYLLTLGTRVAERLGPGRLFAQYVVGYTLGRLWIELVRIDPASELWGQRVNVWTSLVVMAAGLVWLATGLRRTTDGDEPVQHESESVS